ncbi:hypothetical protein ACJX0J_008261, partial [Zea mays]
LDLWNTLDIDRLNYGTHLLLKCLLQNHYQGPQQQQVGSKKGFGETWCQTGGPFSPLLFNIAAYGFTFVAVLLHAKCSVIVCSPKDQGGLGTFRKKILKTDYKWKNLYGKMLSDPSHVGIDAGKDGKKDGCLSAFRLHTLPSGGGGGGGRKKKGEENPKTMCH